MKEPDDEGLASHIGPESCADVRKDVGEALTGGHVGWVLSREILDVQGADGVKKHGRPHGARRDASRAQTLRGRRPHARVDTPRQGTGRSQGRLGHQGRIAKSQDIRR
jgi:hypothetical protein